jgi:uncharacterized repeat protein (TIGR03803 family)
MPSQRMLSGSSQAAQPRLLLPAESVHPSTWFQERLEEGGNSMRQKKFWFTMSGILAVLAVALMLPTGTVAASKYKVLHRFTGKDGALPSSDLIFAAGNLYGTTYFGGAHNGGTVFKLTPHADGSWTESVLYNFCQRGCGGYLPTAGLVFDTAGNLYGTTDEFGGVFKLAPNSDGTWTESVLTLMFRPSSGTDLIFDTAGNLYGEEEVDGAFGYGMVFELAPNLDGTWTESVLYSFTGGSDGGYPSGRLSRDAAGNLYGTTGSGGAGHGVVFELTPNSDGTWTESVLHSFTVKDGSYPLSGVTLDAAGNLYGTTAAGGIPTCTDFVGGGCGVVFKLDTSRNYSVLHKFANHPGANPTVSPILDAAGNLYGTTDAGGPADAGVVFKMAPTSNGSWAFSVLHVFLGKPAEHPNGLVLDKAGNLYGTTSSSGANGSAGVVYEITP